MKSLRIIRTSLFLALVAVMGLVAQNDSTSDALQGSTDFVNVVRLGLLKDELQATHQTLIKIRDSQNTSTIKSVGSAIQTSCKEIMYVAMATSICIGSSVLGLNALGIDSGDKLERNTPIKCAVAVFAPIHFFVCYYLMKLIFGRLLATLEQKNVAEQNIKESLAIIDLVLNRLDYDIKKIECLLQSAKVIV